MGFRNEMFGGVTLVREAMQSPNYAAGVSGWSIKRDGSVEFNNGTFRGSLVAGDISIGTSPNWFRVDSSGNVWTGGATFAAANFSIANTGVVSVRSTSTNPRMQFTDGNAAPFTWPAIYAAPFGSNGRRLLQVYSGQVSALARSASLLLYSADTSPLISVAQVQAQEVSLTATPSSVDLTLRSTGATLTGNLAITGTASMASGSSCANQFVANRFWAWGGTTSTWSDANFVASSIDGSASSNTWRTNPLASQARVGVVIQDVYWRNSVDTGYIGHQAANFTVGSRASTKHAVVDVDEAAGVDVLEALGKLRPIRYRQSGMDEGRIIDGFADALHHYHPERRALGPAGAVRDAMRQWESSITHYGFTVEDVAGVFPDAVVLGDDGAPVGWSVPSLLALVVRAVQQLTERLNTSSEMPTGAR
jgi:hypothetical protein